MPQTLTIDISGHVATITLDRPEKLNAMNDTMWRELHHVVERVSSAPTGEIRAVVFTGAGTSFSVGGDIEGFESLRDLDARTTYIDDVMSVYRSIEVIPCPTVAAVHGHALGGGCELTMVCDIVVADETARFGLPEARVGLFPGIAAVRGLDQLNQHWLRYMIFTGEHLGAEQARLAGLVNVVVPAGEHLAAATRIADRIAANAPLATREAKRMLDRGSDAAYAEARRVVPSLMSTEDHAEGIAAFRERRTADFGGA
jgi:enoyl-CoA hydratase/carnithine racemase